MVLEDLRKLVAREREKVKRFLTPNISNRGRLVRAAGGAACLVGAFFAYAISLWLTLVLGLLGVFMLFEAARGWCALRACGVKTKV